MGQSDTDTWKVGQSDTDTWKVGQSDTDTWKVGQSDTDTCVWSLKIIMVLVSSFYILGEWVLG